MFEQRLSLPFLNPTPTSVLLPREVKPGHQEQQILLLDFPAQILKEQGLPTSFKEILHLLWLTHLFPGGNI